jgi:ubiquitin-conjugating enzyme E2 J2
MYTPSGRFAPDKKICFSMSDFHPGSVRLLTPHTPSLFLPCHESGIQRGALPPCPSTISSPNPSTDTNNRLTGLLSFMLSDEMTTGSVNTTDADKRTYAARSHAWNIQQRKFKDAFPDVRTPVVIHNQPGPDSVVYSVLPTKYARLAEHGRTSQS